MSDLRDFFFKDTPFVNIALKKLSPVADNFRFFRSKWLGDKPEEWEVMEVTGAEFREAKSGRNKGKLSIMVSGTTRTAYVTVKEMEELEVKHDTK